MFWDVLDVLGMFRVVLRCFLDILVRFGMFWDVLDVVGHFEIFLDIFRHFGMFWDVLGCSGTCKHNTHTSLYCTVLYLSMT